MGNRSRRAARRNREIEGVLGPWGPDWVRLECEIGMRALDLEIGRLASRGGPRRKARAMLGAALGGAGAALLAGIGAAMEPPLSAPWLLGAGGLGLGGLLWALDWARQARARARESELREAREELDALALEAILLEEGDALAWSGARREALALARGLSPEGFWDAALEALAPRAGQPDPGARCEGEESEGPPARRASDHPARRASDRPIEILEEIAPAGRGAGA